MEKEIKILAFGEIIWDETDGEYTIGGAPLNFCAHARISGAKAYLVSAVGNDALGARAKSELKRLGICDDYVCENEKQTGRCVVTKDNQGIPTYNILTDVAYDYIDVTKTYNSSFDAVVFGTLALRCEHNQKAIAGLLKNTNFGEVFCDLNLRPPYYNNDVIEFCLKNATILKVSEDELAHVCSIYSIDKTTDYEKSLKYLLDKFSNLKIILLTLGENGSISYSKDSGIVRCDAIKTTVVSTVGAGDSFGATFLSAYLQGNSIYQSMQKGAKRSAFVVSQLGAIPDLEESIWK